MGYAASVYFEEAYYIFGGSVITPLGYSDWSTNIGRLDAVKRTWSLAGSLNQARDGHGVIFDGSQHLVIGGGGGGGGLKTEVCDIIGETVTCTLHSEALYDYKIYPELLLVDGNYGNDC